MREGDGPDGARLDHLRLSARETEVLLLLERHLATDEIARELEISEHTVRSHVKSLLGKLGVSSRREALDVLAAARWASSSSPKPSSAASTSPGGCAGCSRPRARRRHVERAAWYARELAKALGGELEIGKWVGDVRVEAAGDDQQLGLEAPDCPLDDSPRLEVRGVAGARRQRQVDHGLALVVGAAAAGVKRPLVERDEQDRGIVCDEILRPVAMVDVPVDDRDPLDLEVLLRPPCGDRRRAEQAEAHRVVVLRVVAGGTRQRESARPRRVDRRARREQGRLERRARADRVGVEQAFGRPHPLDELVCVAAAYVLDRGG